MAEEFKLGPLQIAWLEALESGKYEQGHHYLKRDDRFCCLGVLCDLAGSSHGDWDVHLPDSLVEQYGFFTNYGEVDRGAHDSLVCMNDTGASFAQIAAFIRANPEKVFKKAA